MGHSTEARARVRASEDRSHPVKRWRLMCCIQCVAVSFAGGCSRDEFEIDLREPDWLAKVNLEKAIQKYEAERAERPRDVEVLRKLGNGYEKKEDWARMASVYREAASLAPADARCHFKLGFAHLKLALLGQPRQWELAERSLSTCLSRDPHFAECHHYLGVVNEYRDLPRAALEHYTAALRSDPEDGSSFEALAGLYYALHEFEPASAVAAEGLRHLTQTERNAPAYVSLYTIQARVAWFRHDEKSELTALESAVQFGDAPPELYFELGLAYLRARSPTSVPAAALDRLANSAPTAASPQKALGAQWLGRFSRRCCRGEARKRSENLCKAAESEMIGLHGQGIGW